LFLIGERVKSSIETYLCYMFPIYQQSSTLDEGSSNYSLPFLTSFRQSLEKVIIVFIQFATPQHLPKYTSRERK